MKPYQKVLIRSWFDHSAYLQLKFINKNTRMNKSKVSISQAKVKPKLPLMSPTNNKSLSKTKQKTDKVSPRSNRIHTLQAKKVIQIPKRIKAAIQIETFLLERTPSNNEGGKGYETPKFKCEVETLERAKKGQVNHNFFSFGEKEFQKDPVRKKADKVREKDRVKERESIPMKNRDTRDARPYRKDYPLR